MKKKCAPLSASTHASIAFIGGALASCKKERERLSGKTALPWESDIHTETILFGVTIAVMKRKATWGEQGLFDLRFHIPVHHQRKST